MSVVVRKIDKGKWLQNKILDGEDVSADAITNCTKTKNNSLSVWEVPNEDQVDEAVLAILSGHDHLETFDIVVLQSTELMELGISLDHSKGICGVRDLVDNHVDIIELTYRKLGILAEKITEGFQLGKVKRYRKTQLKALLLKAISDNRLDICDLSEYVRKKIEQ